MSEDVLGSSEREIIEVGDGAPRSITARIAITAGMDISTMGQHLAHVIASRDDEFVREAAKEILDIHERLKTLFTKAKAEDAKEWHEQFGESFSASIRKNRIPGAGAMMRQMGPGGMMRVGPKGV